MTQKSKKRKIRTARVLVLVFAILAVVLVVRLIQKRNWEKEQELRRTEITSWLESRKNFENQISSVQKPEDMEQESFDLLKSLAMATTDYSWMFNVNEDTVVSDEMMEQLKSMPDNNNDWGKLMTSLDVIPAYYANMAITDDDRLSFILKYPQRESMENPPETLTESLDSIPLLIQWDDRWGYVPYGDQTIAVAGCGPTSMAMVLSYLNQDPSITPAVLAKTADENGLYVIGAGSSHEIYPFLASVYGVDYVPFETSAENIVDLASRNVPIILQMLPGDFTRTGHFIVISGVENGQLKVNDPNSKKRSAKLWDPELVASQSGSGWYFTKSDSAADASAADNAVGVNDESLSAPVQDDSSESGQ